jgi:hypothetical protein
MLQDGLHQKYYVIKMDDPEGTHQECPFFVLDIKHDRSARFAMLAYAISVKRRGFVKLHDDLKALLKRTKLEQ